MSQAIIHIVAMNANKKVLRVFMIIVLMILLFLNKLFSILMLIVCAKMIRMLGSKDSCCELCIRQDLQGNDYVGLK